MGDYTKGLKASRIERKLIIAALHLIADAADDSALRGAVIDFDEAKTEDEHREAFSEIAKLIQTTADFSFQFHIDTVVGGLRKLI